MVAVSLAFKDVALAVSAIVGGIVSAESLSPIEIALSVGLAISSYPGSAEDEISIVGEHICEPSTSESSIAVTVIN